MSAIRLSKEELFQLHNDSSKSQPEPLFASDSNSLPSEGSPTYGNSGLGTKLLMILPLALHFLGSLAAASILLFLLDGRQFYLERQPRVKLADGTYESKQLGQYNLLQSDITTMISGLLLVLRWIFTAWAGPLCWRVVFLLAERGGLRRRDIKWVTSYGILPPTKHALNHLNLMVGMLLLLNLAPYPASPLLTGSISWIPSNLTVELPYHPNISITGFPPNHSRPEVGFITSYRATFSTDVIRNFNTAWGQAAEKRIFKRVVPSVAQLSLETTVENVIVPYFSVTNIRWFSTLHTSHLSLFDDMRQDQLRFPDLSAQVAQPGAAVLLSNVDVQETSFRLAVLINVGIELYPQKRTCSPTTTLLPNNTTIPAFYLNLHATSVNDTQLYGCFAFAEVSFDAATGLCNSCRVGLYSTVQNDTELGALSADIFINKALRDMPKYIPTMTPLKDSLPDPANDIEAYLIALLTRLYSALWNSWTDASAYRTAVSTRYKPALSTLKAEISQARVYAWLVLQLSASLAGLVFLWLQSKSRYPLLGDTRMVAFDIDSTEAVKSSQENQCERKGMLRIEPKDDGWKVVVASGCQRSDYECLPNSGFKQFSTDILL